MYKRCTVGHASQRTGNPRAPPEIRIMLLLTQVRTNWYVCVLLRFVLFCTVDSPVPLPIGGSAGPPLVAGWLAAIARQVASGTILTFVSLP